MQNSNPSLIPRLIIFTHVLHYRRENQVLAHGPYVNEINALAQQVTQVVLIAPLVTIPTVNIPEGNSPYQKTPIILPLPIVGGTGWQKVAYLWKGPKLFFQVFKGVLMPGVLHPRAPGSVALVALILIAIFARGKRKFAKFAGEWDDFTSLPQTFRWQRFWLSKRWLFNGSVLVYTTKMNPSNIISSFTSNLTKEDIIKANVTAKKKQYTDKLIIVFAGRLVKNKGVDILLDALSLASNTSKDWELLVMGDGVEFSILQEQAGRLGIANHIKWLGWCSQKSMMEYLQHAHIVCQPTRFSESWGKVLQEGMAFGCVPIASAIGGLKRQLNEKPELLFEAGNAVQCAAIINNIMIGTLNYEELKQWSIDKSNLYSLNELADFTWRTYHAYYD
jgi:glycosyltransferase involved in cell wall biosynthesis